MTTLTFEGEAYACRAGESVLDTLLRNGVNVKLSCRKGVCKTCLLRVVEGPIPAAAQRGLSPRLKAEGYVMACVCVPKADVRCVYPGKEAGARDQTKELAPDYATEAGTLEFPPPDPELWKALEQNGTLNAILRDFYEHVYQDERLKPFFKSVTRERAIEKQYSFLYQAFSGKPVFLGEMPRNAHHWMVISDELFTYREELMETYMRKHGLAAPLIQRWRAYQERFREEIVKASPWPKILEGIEPELGQLEVMEASIPMLCDHCGGEIAMGERMRYHTRLGATYCLSCME